MSEDQSHSRSDQWKQIEREVRKDRSFSLADAIGQLAGPGAMKGASPVTRKQQAEVEIGLWLTDHLRDGNGALQVALLRYVSGSELLLNNLDQPLVVLGACCQTVLDSDHLLKELVREADFEWGRAYGERPHFDREGQRPDADDPYTIESVRNGLSNLINQLGGGTA